MGALNDPKVGQFINEHFVASFQKVGTFRIVGGTKQGGNVATYFCAPDGRVLHVVAGPVDAATMLAEARWVVATTRDAIKKANGDGAKFKQIFRIAHAEKLAAETGLKVEPLAYDPPDAMSDKDALTYRDPTGAPLAPKLPPPPIDGPDVRLTDAEFNKRQTAANQAPGARQIACKRTGRNVVINNQAIVHQLMAAHAMVTIERVYGTVFENILGEQVSTKPVEVRTPFSWLDKAGNRISR